MQFRDHVIRAGMDALYFSGAYALLRPLCAGVGTILMLHHVRPGSDAPFQPNRHLEITPEFLRRVVAHLRESGTDIVTLDEMHRRLGAGEFDRRFACLTFDDGYRDNRDFALPVMAEFDAPFTVYAASDFAEGVGKLWWVALEQVIARADTIETGRDGHRVRLSCGTPRDKQAAFVLLHSQLRDLDESELHSTMGELCTRHGIDYSGISRELCLSWEELKTFAANPLVTIGVHTVSHCNLAKASTEAAASQLTQSRSRIETALGRPAEHLAYPYGDRMSAGPREFELASMLGFKTAVTTRPGMVFAESTRHLTALPRLSLNGNYQDMRSLNVLVSGAATAMLNGFRRVDAA